MNAIADIRLPLYQRIRDELAARIAQREWQPGEALPSEAELALQYAAAIGTVRKAVEQLVADGLLDRRQGRGTFIRKPRFASSMFRFFRFQSQQGERPIPHSRIIRCEMLKPPAFVAEALKMKADAHGIYISRVRSIDERPLLAEEIWLDAARFSPLLGLKPDEFGDLLYPLYEERCGQSVISATETLSIASATAMQARLLRKRAGAPLVVIERLALDIERHPIEWRLSHGPADELRYSVEIR